MTLRRRKTDLRVKERNMPWFLSDEGPTLETLDFTIRIDSTPTFLYFDCTLSLLGTRRLRLYIYIYIHIYIYYIYIGYICIYIERERERERETIYIYIYTQKFNFESKQLSKLKFCNSQSTDFGFEHFTCTG